MQKTNSLYVRLFTDADFKLWKGLDLGVKFQYERKNINIKQFDEANSYKMRELVNRYTSGSVGNISICPISQCKPICQIQLVLQINTILTSCIRLQILSIVFIT